MWPLEKVDYWLTVLADCNAPKVTNCDKCVCEAAIYCTIYPENERVDVALEKLESLLTEKANR